MPTVFRNFPQTMPYGRSQQPTIYQSLNAIDQHTRPLESVALSAALPLNTEQPSNPPLPGRLN